MATSVIKNPRKIFTSPGGDSSLPPRVTILENNEYKITYYEIISGASGSVTLSTGATINAGEFGLSGNAILSKIDGSNKPTFESPLTAGGVVVTASLNVSSGAWVTSGVYTDASVALIYSIKIKAINYGNLVYNNIVGDPEEIGTEKIVNKSSSYTVSSTTTYANTKALVDGLATKGSGTILGTVGATNGLIPFGNGTANTIQSSTNFLYTESSLNSFFTIGSTRNDIPLLVTNRETIVTAFNTDYDPNIVSARTIADSIITNSHGFVEATVFKSTTTNLANNAFTDNGILKDPTGVAGNYNHHASYQSQVKLNNTGTTDSLYFGADAPTVNSGTLTNRYGFYFYDGVGTGTIVNQYGLYIPTLSKGSTINEAIHVVSNDSYFGGKIKMVTTSGGANVEAPQVSWYHASTIKTSYITDKIINNTSELKFNVSTYNFAGYKEMLTLRGDDTNTGSDYAIINSTKLGLYNVTPIIRATTGGTASTFVSNTSLIANDTATFDGYTIGQVIKALRNLGILT